MKNRWVILEHRVAKNVIDGLHYDLLIEEDQHCRTWKLEKIPILDGPPVSALLQTPHKLYWLERNESIVSGGRGWAKRVGGGIFLGSLPENDQAAILITLVSETISGCLEISNNYCRLFF